MPPRGLSIKRTSRAICPPSRRIDGQQVDNAPDDVITEQQVEHELRQAAALGNHDVGPAAHKGSPEIKSLLPYPAAHDGQRQHRRQQEAGHRPGQAEIRISPPATRNASNGSRSLVAAGQAAQPVRARSTGGIAVSLASPPRGPIRGRGCREETPPPRSTRTAGSPRCGSPRQQANQPEQRVDADRNAQQREVQVGLGPRGFAEHDAG